MRKMQMTACLSAAIVLGVSFMGAATVQAGESRGPAHVRANLVPKLERLRGSIPLEFLAGWVMVESDGKLDTLTSLGERGYFQIHPDEAREILKLGNRFQDVNKDSDFSLQQGVALVRYYSKAVERRGIKATDPSFWPLAKLHHGGLGYAKKALDSAKAAGVNLADWPAIYRHIVQSNLPSVIKRIARNVELTRQMGACVMSSRTSCTRDLDESKVASPQPATPNTTPVPSTSGSAQSSFPSFPFPARVTTGLGFRKSASLQGEFVIDDDKYVEPGDFVFVMSATGRIGAPNTFCNVVFRMRRGFIRCDKIGFQPLSLFGFRRPKVSSQSTSSEVPEADSTPVSSGTSTSPQPPSHSSSGSSSGSTSGGPSAPQTPVNVRGESCMPDFEWNNYKQFAGSWKDERVHPGYQTFTNTACHLTSWSIALKYWGVNVTPPQLRDKVRNLRGFDKGEKGIHPTGTALASIIGDRSLSLKRIGHASLFHQHNPDALAKVRQHFCVDRNSAPMLARIDYEGDNDNSSDHYIAIIGYKDGEPIVLDPGSSDVSGNRDNPLRLENNGKTRQGYPLKDLNRKTAKHGKRPNGHYYLAGIEYLEKK